MTNLPNSIGTPDNPAEGSVRRHLGRYGFLPRGHPVLQRKIALGLTVRKPIDVVERNGRKERREKRRQNGTGLNWHRLYKYGQGQSSVG